MAQYGEFAGRYAIPKFTVNSHHLREILGEMKIVHEESQDEKGTLEKQLLDDNSDLKTSAGNYQDSLIALNDGLDFDLIKRALGAHIFEQHVINKGVFDIKISVLQKRKHSNNLYWKIRAFLKKDLFISEIGYGISYEIKYGTLYFSGVVEEEFANQTVVLQIKTRKHRILKELYLIGENLFSNDFYSGVEDNL